MTVVFLRAHEVAPDPRVERAIIAAREVGHDVEVLAWDRSGCHSVLHEEQVDGRRVRIRRAKIRGSLGAGMRNAVALIRFQLFLLWELFCLGRKSGIIHACDLSTGLVGLLWAKFARCRFVYDIFDYYADAYPVPTRLRSVVQWLEGWVIDRADIVLLASEGRLTQIGGSHPKAIEIIHNSPSPIVISNSGAERVFRRYRFVYVGLLIDSRMVEEVASLVAKRKDWEIHIGGYGPAERRIRRLANQYENVYFHGRLDYASTLSLEASADLLFAVYDPKIPNHRFSAPNKFYEALMLGKPVIVAQNTGVDELVEKHDVGAVVPYSVAAFECAAESLLEDKGKRADISARGPAVFASEYSGDIMRARLRRVYALMQ